MNGSYCVRVLLIVLGCTIAWVQHVSVRRALTSHRVTRLGVARPRRSVDAQTPLDEFAGKLDEQLRNQVVNVLSVNNVRKNLAIISSLPEYLQGVQSVTGRYVKLKGETQYQLAYKGRTNEKVKNYDLDEAVHVIRKVIGSGLFKSAHFLDGSSLHKLEIKTPPGSTLEFRYKVEKAPRKKVPSVAAVLAHDLPKNAFIPMDAPFLQSLGITYQENAGGRYPSSAKPEDVPVVTIRPRVGMADKLGQIQKFLEILDGMVKGVPEVQSRAGTDRAVRVVDMGSGLAYLTFAVHAHFVKSFPALRTVGVERRADLTDRTNAIAAELGRDFEGLSFHTSAIEDSPQAMDSVAVDSVDPTGGEAEAVDVLIALHACDTATDDAILHGIRHNASMIVVSPCCHKEVRGQLELEKHKKEDHYARALAEVLVHRIYREWQSEMLTDTLRALCLQYMGYDTKVFEFVSGEHTAKNTMIAATRRSAPLSQAQREVLQEKFRNLMQVFGIHSQRLISALGLDAALSSTNNVDVEGE